MEQRKAEKKARKEYQEKYYKFLLDTYAELDFIDQEDNINKQLESLGQRGGLEGIESINAYGCQLLTKQSLRWLPTDLRSLNIGNNPSLAIEDIRHLTALSTLKVSKCEQVNKSWVESLTTLSTLTCLDLSSCNLSSSTVRSLTLFSALKNLDLSGNISITNEDL